MQGLAGLDAISVIVDDSEDVWPGHKDNLVMVERYVFFPSSRRQLGLSRASMLETGMYGLCIAQMLSILFVDSAELSSSFISCTAATLIPCRL